jgi:hypothetical protein
LVVRFFAVKDRDPEAQDIAGKQLEVLKEAIPGLLRAAFSGGPPILPTATC